MRVFVAGATGFLGSHIVPRLLEGGHEVVALARHAKELRALPAGVATVQGDLTKPHTFRGRMLDCDASLNLVGLLRQHRTRGVTYARVVVKGTQNWIHECEEAGVRHALYVSAIGASPDGTPYQRSKWAAEQAVRNSEVPWTILRPSLVAGRGGFAAALAKQFRLKLTPVWGRQNYFFQPVAATDLAELVARLLKSPRSKGKVYHVGGPDAYSYKELLREIARARGRHPWLVPAPWFAAYALGATLGWLPFFPATLENFQQLRQGNVAPEDAWSTEFKLAPTPLGKALQRAETPSTDSRRLPTG